MDVVKSRIHWVDVAKGVLILFLLIHHFGSASRLSKVNSKDFDFVFVWQFVFTSFFIQAFFFMSGYCSNFSKPVLIFIKDIIKQLIIPFLFFELLNCIIFNLDDISIRNMYSYWVEANGTHLWFLNALIVSKVILYIIKSFYSDEWLLFISLLLLFFAVYLKQRDIGSNFFCIRQCLGSVLFVALGYYVKNKSYMERFELLGWFFPIALLTMKLSGVTIPVFTANMDVGFKSLFLFLFVSIAGVIFFSMICMKIAHSKFLEFLGRNTIIIYCVHFLFLQYFVVIFYSLIVPENTYQRILYLVIVYIFELLACVVSIEIFKHKPLKWIVGKW